MYSRKSNGTKTLPCGTPLTTLLNADIPARNTTLWLRSVRKSIIIFKRNAFFNENRPFCVSEAPLGDLGATYEDRLRLIGKRVVDFLLALMNFFSLGVTAEELRAIIG